MVLNFRQLVKMDLDEDNENFFKVASIVTDAVPKSLRKFFVEKWNQKFPGNTWESGKTSSGDDIIARIKAENNNKEPQYKEKLRAGNENDWDTTVLMYVLDSSKLKLITANDKKNLDKLRKFRNEYFAHATKMVCPSIVFTQKVSEIRVIAKAVFGEDAKNEIDKILNSRVTTEMSRNLEQQLIKEEARNKEFEQLVSDIVGKE